MNQTKFPEPRTSKLGNLLEEAQINYTHYGMGNPSLGVPILYLSLAGNWTQDIIYIKDRYILFFLLLKIYSLAYYFTNDTT